MARWICAIITLFKAIVATSSSNIAQHLRKKCNRFGSRGVALFFMNCNVCNWNFLFNFIPIRWCSANGEGEWDLLMASIKYASRLIGNTHQTMRRCLDVMRILNQNFWSQSEWNWLEEPIETSLKSLNLRLNAPQQHLYNCGLFFHFCFLRLSLHFSYNWFVFHLLSFIFNLHSSYNVSFASRLLCPKLSTYFQLLTQHRLREQRKMFLFVYEIWIDRWIGMCSCVCVEMCAMALKLIIVTADGLPTRRRKVKKKCVCGGKRRK